MLAKLRPLHKALFGLSLLVLANVACGMGDWVVTITPTSTFANTPVPSETVLPTISVTPTEVLAKDTPTPEPTSESVGKCAVVTADETVHLRPSPNTSGYPIEVLAKDTQIADLGGRVENDEGTWFYVSVGKNQGWVNGKYIGDC